MTKVTLTAAKDSGAMYLDIEVPVNVNVNVGRFSFNI